MSTIKLAQPSAGEHVVVPSEPFAHIVLDFPADKTLMEHPEGSDSLFFRFADGSAIELQDFYAQYGSGQIPEFEVEGEVLNGEEFFAVFGPELAPAAPPLRDASSGHGLSDILLDDGLDAGVASLEALPQEIQGMDPAEDAAQASTPSPFQSDAGAFSLEGASSASPVILLEPGQHEVSLEEHHDDILLGHAPDVDHEVHQDGDVQADLVSLTDEAIQNGASDVAAVPEGTPADLAAAGAVAMHDVAVTETVSLEDALSADLENAARTVAISS